MTLRRDLRFLGLVLCLVLLTGAVEGRLDAHAAGPWIRSGPVWDKLWVVKTEARGLPERVELVNDSPLSDELYRAVLDACDTYEVPVEVVLGIIETESGFDPAAVNPEGCYGLMQLNPRYFPAGLTPAENIEIGVGYLREQMDRYGGLEAGLTSYNAGHDTGDRTYASAVLEAAGEWS